MSWHGFRAMASTLLNEQGYAPDVIELQLAHQERNEVRAAYNCARRLNERRKNDAGVGELSRRAPTGRQGGAVPSRQGRVAVAAGRRARLGLLCSVAAR